MVTSDPEKVDVSSKCRMAVKYGLPVLSLDYIWDCLQDGVLKDSSTYVVGGKSSVLDFKAGKISGNIFTCDIPLITEKQIAKNVILELYWKIDVLYDIM